MTMMIESVSEKLESLRAGRVLCAVSGGMDSMCLLHLVLHWGQEHGLEVRAAHFNHGLRGEAADRDEAFVRDICGQWGVPCAVGRGDTNALAAREHLTVEEAARKLRYQFLEQTAQNESCDAILTAHHAEDNAETMLLNLIRGTGIRGLAGIPPSRDRIARVLLDVTREQLAAYAEANEIPWVTDETNLDPDAAARNLVRWKILPLLRELNPRAVEHMGSTAEELWQIDRLLERQIQWITRQEAVVSDKGVAMSLEVLNRRFDPVEAGVLLNLFDLLRVGRKDIGRSHLRALDAMIEGERGRLDLPHGVWAECRDGWLWLRKKPEAPGRMTLRPGVPCRWQDWTLILQEQETGEGLWICGGDASVEVGACPGGERLSLPEGRGARTVKRLCLDRGIPLEQREALPAIYVNNHLAAVWQLGVDTAFLPEGDARRFVQISKKQEEK